MTTPSKTTMTTDRSPDNPAADATGVAVPVQAPQTDPASKTTVSAEINAALQGFVRALARSAAARDWKRAVADLSTETDQPVNNKEAHDEH
jgi:hypothetical protein